MKFSIFVGDKFEYLLEFLDLVVNLRIDLIIENVEGI